MSETATDHLGRNDPCHCGSGKKYKRCCLKKDGAAEREEHAKAAAEAPVPESEGKTAPEPAKPRRETHQPWKRRSGGERAFHRFLTPPKRGGG